MAADQGIGVPGSSQPAVASILDTDLYKLTMQNAVLHKFPDMEVTYQFTNRNGHKQPFTRRCYERIRKMVDELEHLRLTDREYDWLRKACPYFSEDYLAFLRAYRFSPRSEVSIRFDPHSSQTGGDEPGSIQLRIKGKWSQAILYEVPILAIVSEAYFATVDRGWDYRGQVENAKRKMAKMMDAGCAVTDFGTRRRRSYHAQDLVLTALADASRSSAGKGRLAGTSNVHFAMKYGLQPVGTIAHEMIMGVAALSGYPGSNGRVLDLWEELYKGELTIALTDTFSTKPFWEDFCADVERAKRWKGLRQDSGDPATFARMAKTKWQSMGVDPKSKVIVFSDGLDPDKCVELQRLCEHEGIGCAFGVGTNLTNDFRKVDHVEDPYEDGGGEPRLEGAKSPALNIVIKLSTIDNRHCVKISDELTKNTGDEETVMMVKRRFGLEVGMSKSAVASHAVGHQAVEETPAGSPIW